MAEEKLNLLQFVSRKKFETTISNQPINKFVDCMTITRCASRQARLWMTARGSFWHGHALQHAIPRLELIWILGHIRAVCRPRGKTPLDELDIEGSEG
jgi:hypothetical protein